MPMCTLHRSKEHHIGRMQQEGNKNATHAETLLELSVEVGHSGGFQLADAKSLVNFVRRTGGLGGVGLRITWGLRRELRARMNSCEDLRAEEWNNAYPGRAQETSTSIALKIMSCWFGGSDPSL